MSNFKAMKKYLKKNEGCDLCYDSPFSDYIDNLYVTATFKLDERFTDLSIEPSTQCGMGGVFATYVYEGKTYETHWDYEGECESIMEFIEECNSEEELIECIKNYLENKLSEAELCEYDEDDEEYEEDE